MAQIILFKPKIYQTRTLHPRIPLGLLFVAAPLVANSYNVKIIDEEIDPDWPKTLASELDSSTLCVGVSAMTGRQILGGLKFSKIVKDNGGVPVIWGGMHASMLPEDTVKHPLVDIALRGEGEDGLLKIVDVMKNGGSIGTVPNIWYKEKDEICSNPKESFVDLNKLPPLPYHLLNCEIYIKARPAYLPNCRRTFELNTDRGCPHKCGFCYNLDLNKCKWRALTADRVIERLEYLVENFCLDGIHFAADNFFTDKNRVSDICTKIIKKKFKITWHANCRIDYFIRYEDDFIDLLKESGCRTLTFGAESGSQKILDLVDKGIKVEDIFVANKKLKKKKIWANYHIMVGLPEETQEDLLKTYKMMLELYKEYPRVTFFGPHIFTPTPGTPLYNRYIKMGFRPWQGLENWGLFDAGIKTSFKFKKAGYPKWLEQSALIANRITSYPGWIRWWFRLRLKIITKFKIIGPQPELILIRFVKMIRSLGVFR